MDKLTQLKNRLELYLEAERKILSAQSYQIGERNLTRADLGKVRAAIADLTDEINQLENGRGRIKRVVF